MAIHRPHNLIERAKEYFQFTRKGGFRHQTTVNQQIYKSTSQFFNI